MMRRRARYLIEHADEMELADRGDVREVIQVQRLLQVLLHLAHHSLHGFLVGFDGIGAVRAGGCWLMVSDW